MLNFIPDSAAPVIKISFNIEIGAERVELWFLFLQELILFQCGIWRCFAFQSCLPRVFNRINYGVFNNAKEIVAALNLL